uniref:Uncharacterized protein n=1 Tax=Knipowitschia caucasica TaxID=637954 RepID=A0AAV2MBB3_KNICA
MCVAAITLRWCPLPPIGQNNTLLAGPRVSHHLTLLLNSSHDRGCFTPTSLCLVVEDAMLSHACGVLTLEMTGVGGVVEEAEMLASIKAGTPRGSWGPLGSGTVALPAFSLLTA